MNSYVMLKWVRAQLLVLFVKMQLNIFSRYTVVSLMVSFPDVSPLPEWCFPERPFPDGHFPWLDISRKNCSWSSPSTLSVYQQQVWTNNDLEFWHRHINGIAWHSHVPFYMLVDVLFHETQKMWHCSFTCCRTGRCCTEQAHATPLSTGAWRSCGRSTPTTSCRCHTSCALQAACSCTTKSDLRECMNRLTNWTVHCRVDVN